jgi:hypothetical protein
MPLLLTNQRKHSSCSIILNYGEKLTMVDLVLYSFPTFYLSTLKVYQWVLEEFDKYRRHCLWRKNDLEERISPLASWELLCHPKDQEGQRVIDLIVQNNCLLIKYHHKFYNRANFTWVNLIWEVYY